MGADDEFRKVGEDVRELARALRTELREARREARDVARQTRDDLREEYRAYRRTGHTPWQGSGGPRDGGPRDGAPRDGGAGRPGWYAGWGPSPGPTPWSPGAPGAPAGPANDGSPGAGDGSGGPITGRAHGEPGDAIPGGVDAGSEPAFPWGRSGSASRGPRVIRTVGAPPGYPAGYWSPQSRTRPPRPPRPPRMPRPPKPPRESRQVERMPPVRHRRDGSTLLSLLLVFVGLAWLASESGTFAVSSEAVLAIILVLLGAGMVVTARTDWALSRRAWPVWLGAGVLLMLLASTNGSSIGDRLAGIQLGPQDRTPLTWADAATPIDNFAGPVTVNLSNVTAQAGDPDETLRIRATAGPIDLTVPGNPLYHLHIRARATAGPIRIDGSRARGGFRTERTVDFGPASAHPRLEVDLDDGAGPITVHVNSTPSP